MCAQKRIIASIFSFIVLSFFNYTSAYAILPSFIRGTVYNAHDGTLINSATIAVSSALSTSTSNGTFSVRVPPNVYDIIVSSNGYRANLISGVHAAPGQTATVNIWLIPSSTSSAILEGKVLDSVTGSGVASAFVITDVGGLALTDNNGSFSMSSPSGTSEITVAANTYSTKIQQSVVLTPNRKREIIIYLSPSSLGYAPVSGTVRDACVGTTLQNARICTPGEEISFSDENGMYASSSSAGLSTLLASADEHQFVYKNIFLYPVIGNSRLNINLFPSKNGYGLLKGIVYDDVNSLPVAGARLETDTGDIGYSNDDGSYVLYTSFCSTSVAVSHEGFVDEKVLFTIPAGTPLLLDIPLDPLASVSGTIYDAYDNHAVIGAEVLLLEEPSLSSISDMNGRYAINRIPPSQYTLSAVHRCYEDDNSTITFAVGDTIDADLYVSPVSTSTIYGFIHDALTGQPIPSARIVADHGTETYTDTTGFFTVTLPACPTTFTFSSVGYLSRTQYVNDLTENMSVEINAELTPCPVIMALRNAEHLDGIAGLVSWFRSKRDVSSSKSTIIKKYIRLFYLHAAEIASFFSTDPVLMQQCSTFLVKFYMHTKDRNELFTDVLDPDLAEEFFDLINECNKKPLSPMLKSAITSFLDDVQSGTVPIMYVY